MVVECKYCGKKYNNSRTLAQHVWRQRSKGDVTHARTAQAKAPTNSVDSRVQAADGHTSPPQVTTSNVSPVETVKPTVSTTAPVPVPVSGSGDLPALPAGNTGTVEVTTTEIFKKDLPPLPESPSTPQTPESPTSPSTVDVGAQFKNIISMIQSKYNEAIDVKEGETDLEGIKRRLRWTDEDTEHLAAPTEAIIGKYLPTILKYWVEVSFGFAVIIVFVPKLFALQELRRYSHEHPKQEQGFNTSSNPTSLEKEFEAFQKQQLSRP